MNRKSSFSVIFAVGVLALVFVIFCTKGNDEKLQQISQANPARKDANAPSPGNGSTTIQAEEGSDRENAHIVDEYRETAFTWGLADETFDELGIVSSADREKVRIVFEESMEMLLDSIVKYGKREVTKNGLRLTASIPAEVSEMIKVHFYEGISKYLTPDQAAAHSIGFERTLFAFGRRQVVVSIAQQEGHKDLTMSVSSSYEVDQGGLASYATVREISRSNLKSIYKSIADVLSSGN